MSLEYSVASLMARLADWSGFPKYQLERRVDIFTTPFLEPFLSDRLGGDVVLVAPEFPLPRRFATKGPVKEEDPDAQTINVDYLLHVARPAGQQSAWVFLELKTNFRSFRKRQDLAYERARDKGMEWLRADLPRVRRASKKHHGKHEHLEARLARLGFGDDRIELVYLAPAPLGGFQPKEGENPIRYFSLAEFAAQPTAQIAPEHRDLWPYVRDLLRSIEAAPRVRRGPTPVMS